jgi:NCS2 family nucleobase:cation symporter-2
MMAVGFQLGLLALSQIFSVTDLENAFYDSYFLAACVSIFTMVFLIIWARGILRLLAPFIGITVGFIVSGFLGILSPESIAEMKRAPWIAFPNIGEISYSFSPEFLWPFTLAGIAASLRTLGGITTCQKINDEAWVQPDLRNIKKGLFADGLGCAIGGFLGVPPQNTAPSLIGVAQATGATSRIIALSLAIWLFAFAFLPKFIFLFLSIPLSVMGSALLFTASFMIAGGLEVIASRKIDTRSVIIIGVSLLLGISQQVFPTFYSQLHPIVKIFTNSLLSVVTLSAFLLNLIFRIGSRQVVILGDQAKPQKSVREELERLGERLPAKTVARITDSTSALIKLLKGGYLKEGDLHVSLVKEQVDVIVNFRYLGSLPKIRFDDDRERMMIEETSYVVGLSQFLVEIFADHVKTSVRDTSCSISLSFHV